MPTDRVLIEIVTAANMAGVQEAKAGMLGLNPVTLAAGLLLGGLVMAGKSAMAVAEAHTAAENQLTQALKDRNAMIGQAMPISVSAENQIAKATKAHADAVAALVALEQGRYVPATHLTELQLMKLQDAQARVASTTKVTTAGLSAHATALRRLAELQVGDAARVHGATTAYGNLSAAQKKVADTASKLALLQNTVGVQMKFTGINAVEVTNELGYFIHQNREYISSQEDVINMTTLLVREGVSLKDLTRDQALAMDLAAAKGIPLATATELVAKAQAGQFRGLKDLLGIMTPTIPATATLAQKNKLIEAAMDAAAKKVRDASHAITDQKKAINALGNDWHDFAIGPGADLNQALTNAYQILDLMDQFLAKGGLQTELVDAATAIERMIPGLSKLQDIMAALKIGGTLKSAGSSGPGYQTNDPNSAYQKYLDAQAAKYAKQHPGPAPKHTAAASNTAAIHLHGATIVTHTAAQAKQLAAAIRANSRSAS